jgi:hypothetical protein
VSTIIKLCNLRLHRRKVSNRVNRLAAFIPACGDSYHVLSGLSRQIPLW